SLMSGRSFPVHKMKGTPLSDRASATLLLWSPPRVMSSIPASINPDSMTETAFLTMAPQVTDLHPSSFRMPSTIIKISISSSTTRMRRPDSSSLMVGHGGGYFHRADHPFSTIIELHHTTQLVRKASFQHMRAEPFAQRRCHNRSFLFRPDQKQLPTRW